MPNQDQEQNNLDQEPENTTVVQAPPEPEPPDNVDIREDVIDRENE